MAKSSIMVDLDDPRTGKIADAISNNTCKKILTVLSEKEFSEGDIAKKLNIPLNTVGYNIKKLVEAGLIEKSKQFFWSIKGKKILTYKLSNKKIIISPKTMIRGIIPTIIISGLIALSIRFISISQQSFTAMQKEADKIATEVGSAAEISTPAVQEGTEIIATTMSSAWLWFLTGALTALFIFLIWNWIRGKK